MSGHKNRSVRLPDELSAAMELVARIDGVPTSALIRDAVVEHIERRRNDSDFQARLRERIEADERVLERLST